MPFKGNLHATFSKSTHHAADKPRGKVVVNWKADPVHINLNEKAIAADLAHEAMMGIAEEIKAIPDRASPETVARRERALKQWTSGKMTSALKKRYSGGRIGPMPPRVTDALLNDSGRLIRGLTLNPRRSASGEAVITLNVPANRFKAETFGGGEQGLEQRVFSVLRKHVSWFQSANAIASNQRYKDAIARARNLTVATTDAKALQNATEIARAIAKLARAAISIAGDIATAVE